jgi:hypothetical protein
MCIRHYLQSMWLTFPIIKQRKKQKMILSKGTVFPAHALKAYMGSRAILILSLNTWWSWVVNFPTCITKFSVYPQWQHYSTGANVERLILPSPRAHLCIVKTKVCVLKQYQSSTAVHATHPQYSHYDLCISVGTLSDLVGCSNPSEHSAITHAVFLDCHIIFLAMTFTEFPLACISTSRHSMYFFV